MKTTHLSGKEHEKEEQESWKGNDQNLIMKKEEEKAKWDCGSPLYDSYELVSLNHLIDRNLMVFPYGSNQFSHHSHDVVMENKTGSLEKSKESSWVTSLSNLLVKMKKRKDNEERTKKNKEMRRGLARCVYNKFTSLWRK